MPILYTSASQYSLIARCSRLQAHTPVQEGLTACQLVIEVLLQNHIIARSSKALRVCLESYPSNQASRLGGLNI